MIGVDRLDYSKGIPTRLKAFRQLLQTHARMRSKVTLVQIAAPTRQSIPAYARLRDKTEQLVREINRRFGTGDWTPVMYFSESVDRTALPQLYRMSRVGVVTPVADGMNLVAKEYVAAQAARDPGVLVLSRGAGAASQLRDALLVPSKNRAATADAYAQALSMPLEERKARHAGLMRNIETEDLRWWRDNYLKALACAPWPAGPRPPKTPARTPGRIRVRRVRWGAHAGVAGRARASHPAARLAVPARDRRLGKPWIDTPSFQRNRLNPHERYESLLETEEERLRPHISRPRNTPMGTAKPRRNPKPLSI